MADPARELLNMSKGLIPPILAVIKCADAASFDAEFAKIEGKLAEWKAKFDSISQGSSTAAMNAAASAGELMTQLFTALNQRSKELGATKGRQLPIAAAAAGGKRWKMPRKMSRKYCKKTPCRKMGFTQRSSCRPYKNCFTRRR